MQQKEFNFKLFAKSVKKYRASLKIGLRHAAGQIGTSASTLCRIENEETPEIDTLLTICGWMGKPIDNFIKIKK